MSSGNVRQRRTNVRQDCEGEKLSCDTDVEEPSPKRSRWSVPYTMAIVLLASAVIFVLIPSPIEPVEHNLPEPQELVGVLEPNRILQHAEKLFFGQLLGPESLAVYEDRMYTGTADGWVKEIYKGEVRNVTQFGKGPCGGVENEHSCGRPLGMRIDLDGSLVVVDSYSGIYRVNVTTGDHELLYSLDTRIDGKVIQFLNDMDIGPDGKIYFTSTSDKWWRQNMEKMFLELSSTGRLLVYDPKTKQTSILVEGFTFPNGVQLTGDKSAVLIVDTMVVKVLRYDLKSGQTTVWADNLPGFADNIRYHKSTGTYWLGQALVRQKGKSSFDFLIQRPWLRKQLAKVRPWLRKQLAKVLRLKWFLILVQLFNTPDTKAMALEFDESGNIIRTLQDQTGEEVQAMSEIERVGDYFYLGSYYAPYLLKLHVKHIPKY